MYLLQIVLCNNRLSDHNETCASLCFVPQRGRIDVQSILPSVEELDRLTLWAVNQNTRLFQSFHQEIAPDENIINDVTEDPGIQRPDPLGRLPPNGNFNPLASGL